jgi:hypothetical protein
VEGPGSGIKKAIHLIEEAVGGKVTVEFGAPADEAKDSEPTELDLSKSVEAFDVQGSHYDLGTYQSSLVLS